MKMRKMSLWGMIAVWIILGFLVIESIPCRVSAQSQSGPSASSVERIGVMPLFKGKHPSDVKETLNCPLSHLYYNPESLSTDCDRTLTRHVQEALRKRLGERVVPRAEVMEANARISKNEANDTLRTTGKRLGEELKADLIIVGTVWRYKERVGGASGVDSPASVAFALYLIDMASGKRLWTANFDKTQRSLSEDILDVRAFVKKGARWLTADELARYGVKEVFKKFPL